MTPTKDQIIALLDAWIRQRPGLEFGNYCSGWNDAAGRAAYRAEVRSIGKDLAHARILLRAVELSGITADQLAESFKRAYSGRLSLIQDVKKNGRTAESFWRLSYCTGQYWPTEYRRAACAVLAAALWDYKRDYCMPEGELMHNSETGETLKRYQGKRAGDWLRDQFRREFGRTIAARWFN